eukprot:TRINITY_DN1763_c3_g2_i1.p1 TRINITY_DN1763_c3_g2~~TRINITY_DN1763_c3_g2_i1.p1  ORF type:complete len:971 (+),score=315.73 TRINITY_DN1763_c3_g2_i1:28-2913(+)
MPWGLGWLFKGGGGGGGGKQSAEPSQRVASPAGPETPEQVECEDWRDDSSDARRLRAGLCDALTDNASFVSPKPLTVAVATFNVGEKIPRSDEEDDDAPRYEQWLTAEQGEKADVVAVGLQEVDMSAGSVLFERTRAKAEVWEDTLTALLKGWNFVRVASKNVGSLMMLVFVKEEHAHRVANKRVKVVRVGRAGCSNKGAIALRITVYGRRFLFINTHLDAHTDAVHRRNKHYERILADLDSLTNGSVLVDDPVDLVWPQSPFLCAEGEAPPEAVSAVAAGPAAAAAPGDTSSACGSLHSPREPDRGKAPTRRSIGSVAVPAAQGSAARRRPPASAGNRSSPHPAETSPPRMHRAPDSGSTLDGMDDRDDEVSPHVLDHYDYVFWFGDLNYRVEGVTAQMVHEMVGRGDIASLLPYDQLLQARLADSAFPGFVEATVEFAPTYKFVDGKSEYNRERCPSWTDRVLWKCNPRTWFPPPPSVSQPVQMEKPAHTVQISPDHPDVVACSWQSAQGVPSSQAAGPRGSIPHFQPAAGSRAYSTTIWQSTYSHHTAQVGVYPSQHLDDLGIPLCGQEGLHGTPSMREFYSARGPALPAAQGGHLRAFTALDQVPVARSAPFENSPVDDLAIPVAGSGSSHAKVSVTVLTPEVHVVQLPAGMLAVADLEAVVCGVCGPVLAPNGYRQRALFSGAIVLADRSALLHTLSLPGECVDIAPHIIRSGNVFRVAEMNSDGMWESTFTVRINSGESQLGVRWQVDGGSRELVAVKVQDSAPAHVAGLREGMTLLSVDDRSVRCVEDLLVEVERMRVGGVTKFRVRLPPYRQAVRSASIFRKGSMCSRAGTGMDADLPCALSYRTALPQSPERQPSFCDMGHPPEFQDPARSPPDHSFGLEQLRRPSLRPDSNSVVPLSYRSHRVMLSDHRPVSAAFEVCCLEFDAVKAAAAVQAAVAADPDMQQALAALRAS